MAHNREDVLNALKLELAFYELGGYKPSTPGRLPARADQSHAIPKVDVDTATTQPHKGLSVFQNSPSCLNYGLPTRNRSCSMCWLMTFVPVDKRGEAVPCHQIPLNANGDTVASLGGAGDAPDVQEAVLGWLHRTIQMIEGTPEKSRHHAV
jgi:hypothetical protein